MAFLLLLHEKMRLQRKVNKLTLREAQMASKKERITKNIARVQKMYSSRMSSLEAQAKQGTSTFKSGILQQLGIGTSGINPMMGGASQLAMSGYSALAKELNLNPEAVLAYAQGGIKQNVDSSGKPNADKPYVLADGTVITEDLKSKLQSGVWTIRQAESNAQYQAQLSTSNYENVVSIWLEAAKAELEEEQDAALAPLEALETEYDLERESCEAQLADAKARLESIKQACSEGIKDSAPTFGLG